MKKEAQGSFDLKDMSAAGEKALKDIDPTSLLTDAYEAVKVSPQEEMDREIESYFNEQPKESSSVSSDTPKARFFISSKGFSDRKLNEYRYLTTDDLPFYYCDNLVAVREHMALRFPYAVDVTNRILSRAFRLASFGKRKFAMAPTLLVGGAGTGKSTYFRELSKALGIYADTINVTGEDHWLGVSKGFGTGFPSALLTAAHRSRHMNFALIIDEVDKICNKSGHNNTHARLLSLLEPSENSAWEETFSKEKINASHINWMFTANDLDKIDGPLRSRMQIIEMPYPKKEHIRQMMRSLRLEIAEQDEIDDIRLLPSFNEEDYVYFEDNWEEGMNLRILKRQVECLLDYKFSNVGAYNN